MFSFVNEQDSDIISIVYNAKKLWIILSNSDWIEIEDVDYKINF